MDGRQRVVIVGGGIAGVTTARTLRAHGFAGEIALVGAEARLPYERPPLSKGLLAGLRTPDDLLIAPAETYQADEMELVTGVGVREIDRRGRSVLLSNGRQLGWTTLVLATGATARPLSCAAPCRAYTRCAPLRTPSGCGRSCGPGRGASSSALASSGRR